MSIFYTYELPKRYYTSIIRNCMECPLCYDQFGCMATDDIDDRVRVEGDKIPAFCPLKYRGIEIINNIEEVIDK